MDNPLTTSPDMRQAHVTCGGIILFCWLQNSNFLVANGKNKENKSVQENLNIIPERIQLAHKIACMIIITFKKSDKCK